MQSHEWSPNVPLSPHSQKSWWQRLLTKRTGMKSEINPHRTPEIHEPTSVPQSRYSQSTQEILSLISDLLVKTNACLLPGELKAGGWLKQPLFVGRALFGMARCVIFD